MRVAVSSQPLERGAARIAEAEQPRALVECLAGGVVERLADDLISGALIGHAREQRVPAAGDQAEERGLERRRTQECGRDVSVQVIDRRQRQLVRRSESLRRRHADEQRGHQSRPAGDRDHPDAGERRPRPRERVVDHVTDQLEVMTRRDLGHDPAVAVVDALRGDHVRSDLSLAGDDRRAGIVTTRLEREDHPEGLGVGAVSAVRHMIRASSPVSW